MNLDFLRMYRSASLRFRLATLISILIGSIAVALLVFLPWRMEKFSNTWVERRASGVAHVLGVAVGSGLDFDDATYVGELLNGMSTSSEVAYAVVYRANGSVLAGYHTELAPPPAHVDSVVSEEVLNYAGDQLHVDRLVKGKGGTKGTLSMGFGLKEARSEVSNNSKFVMAVCLVM